MERRRFLQILGALPLFGFFKPAESKAKPVLVDELKYSIIEDFKYDYSTHKDWTFTAWYNPNPNTEWIHYAEVCVDGKVTRYINGEKCT
jgi:hypothetical protein